jgi:hypothetical protein
MDGYLGVSINLDQWMDISIDQWMDISICILSLYRWSIAVVNGDAHSSIDQWMDI